MDLDGFRSEASAEAPANRNFLNQLKKRDPRKVDRAFHDAHEEVFQEIDCLTCANCCKTTSPIFYSADIERLAKHFRIRPSEFIARHLHIDEDGDYVLNQAPCPFLDAENYCVVYEDRPRACREYPHTDRKKMVQLADLTYRNSLICPAVLAILRKLKEVRL